VRLIDRNDTSLAIALIASALVIFQQPLRVVIDAAHSIEGRYNIDLLPGLTVLVGAFGFHQYKKRQRERSTELERLVAFGRALPSALDPASTGQVFWRFLPSFARDRELWMLTRRSDGWDAPLRDATAASERSVESLEALATQALAAPQASLPHGEGILLGDDVCFPMLVGENAVGVLGVRNVPPIPSAERQALGAAAALLAIATRNGQLLAQIGESSVRDALTGCFNRAYAMKTLGMELQRARRTDRPLSVILFDIDEFKSVNDQFGHLAGDATLAAVGARLGAVLRATDVKCRYGGDEFLVILPDTPLTGAQHVAEALTAELARIAITTGGGTVQVTASLGVAVVEPGERDATAVISRADDALYRAKRSGRNRWTLAPHPGVAEQPRFGGSSPHVVPLRAVTDRPA
jgi:diguanylate cyclase (GGDEF)-like protein